MSYFANVKISPEGFSWDAGWRIRVSTLKTLFDGKILNQEDDLIWDTKWTGTATYQNNTIKMEVTAGQYLVRQSKIYSPYFAGKWQIVEFTFDNFQVETGLEKRVGYFSSNAVAPYTSNYDGFVLENDWTTINFRVVNNWTDTLNLDWTQWDNYDLISSYDWSKFTVCAIDYLWLWWAKARLILKTDKGFIVAHTFNYSGTNTWPFTKSSNQCVRYEIRSTTGVWYLTAICSEVASEWGNWEKGEWLSILNTAHIDANSTGTTYALKWIRKTATFRDDDIVIENFWAITVSQNDPWIITLRLDPTVAWTFTYSTNSKIEEATWTNTNTVTGWRILETIWARDFGGSGVAFWNTLRRLLIDLDNTPWEIVLCYQPLTSNQDVHGFINFNEF